MAGDKNNTLDGGMSGVGDHNPGNIQFRTWVELFRKDYLRSMKADRVKISARIVAMVQFCGGRFVEFDTVSQRWIPMNDQKAMETTSQALRELSQVVPISEGGGQGVATQPSSTKDVANSNNNNNNTHYRETFFQLWKSPAILQRTQELLSARSMASSTTLSAASSCPPSPNVLPLPPSSSLSTSMEKVPTTTLGTGPSIPKEPQEPFPLVPLAPTTTKPNKKEPITTSPTAIKARYTFIEVIEVDDEDDDDDDETGVEDPDEATRHNHSKDPMKRPTPIFPDRTIDNHKIRATTLALDDSFDSSSSEEEKENDDEKDDNVPWKQHRSSGGGGGGGSSSSSRKRSRGPPNGFVDLNDLIMGVGKNMARRYKSKHQVDEGKDDNMMVSKSRYAAWHDSCEFMAMGIVDPATFLSEQRGETETCTPSTKKSRSKPHHHHSQHSSKQQPKQRLFGPGQPLIFGDSVTT